MADEAKRIRKAVPIEGQGTGRIGRWNFYELLEDKKKDKLGERNYWLWLEINLLETKRFLNTI
jgi:hypothetical protein